MHPRRADEERGAPMSGLREDVSAAERIRRETVKD
jgi:hypothetical protein